METKIIRTELDWVGVKNSCRTTVNKIRTENAPTVEFKKKILISEHSPICKLKVNWTWENMKSWVSVHFSRHWLGWLKFVSTQRTDRTGVNRDEAIQSAAVNMEIEANAQALINVSRRRLCYQASDETREYMEDLKRAILSIDENISNVMVPNCVYRFGCPEFEMCENRFFARFLDYCKKNNRPISTIQQRYDAYNRMFYDDSEERCNGSEV